MALEEEFELEIPEEEVCKWKTVGDVIRLIKADLEKQAKHIEK
jgi:acyl carrier protein